MASSPGKLNARLGAVCQRLEEMFDLDHFEIDFFLESLLKNLETMHGDIQRHLEAEKWPELIDALRALAGLSANIGLVDLKRLAFLVITAAEHQNAAGVRALLHNLSESFRELGCSSQAAIGPLVSGDNDEG